MQRPINRDEIDRLVLEHLPDALRLARNLAGDAHTAEEVVQEALLRVLRKWRTYRGDASFRTWMMRIVVNAYRDRQRRSRSQQPLPHDPPARSGDPAATAIAAEFAARVRWEIDQLPRRQREVAVVCLGEGATAREAAEVLGTTEANVYATLHLVRKRLANSLGVTAPPKP